MAVALRLCFGRVSGGFYSRFLADAGVAYQLTAG